MNTNTITDEQWEAELEAREEALNDTGKDPCDDMEDALYISSTPYSEGYPPF